MSAALLEALTALHSVVIRQNRLGASWHPEVFGDLMAALALARSALADAAQPAADAALLRELEEPDDELLAEFQRAFLQQLKRRKHKGGESAEMAGARAMFKLAFSRARAAAPQAPKA